MKAKKKRWYHLKTYFFSVMLSKNRVKNKYSNEKKAQAKCEIEFIIRGLKLGYKSDFIRLIIQAISPRIDELNTSNKQSHGYLGTDDLSPSIKSVINKYVLSTEIDVSTKKRNSLLASAVRKILNIVSITIDFPSKKNYTYLYYSICSYFQGVS